MPSNSTKKRRRQRIPAWVGNLILAGASALICLLLLEGVARIYENFIQPVEERESWAFRGGQPAPYQGAPYYGRAFVKEMRKQPGGWVTPGSTTLVMPNDFQGKWFNTRNGQRITIGQPSNPKHTLWLVGGSAVYNAEVPDAFTFATQLQNMINQRQGLGAWKVENVGASTVQSTQELERLKTLPIKAGDIVLFYDGVNDVTQGVLQNNPKGWMVKSNRETLTPTVRILVALRDRSALFRLLVNPFKTTPPAHLDNPKELAKLIDRTISNYGNALDGAAKYSAAHGARFVQVLQPTLFSQPELSDYEKKIAANPSLVAPGMETAIRATYPALQQALPQLASLSSWTYGDFTSVLNGPDEYYLDYCHTTERAGALIAGYLYDLLFGKIGYNSKS